MRTILITLLAVSINLVPTHASGQTSEPAPPAIHNLALNFDEGVVEFDLFNASPQPLVAWKISITCYGADGSPISRASMSMDEILPHPSAHIAPGASRHFTSGVGKPSEGPPPARVGIDVVAYVLADLTAYGDERAIQQWIEDRTELRDVIKRTVEALDRIIASPDSRATMKNELAVLGPASDAQPPAGSKVSKADREKRNSEQELRTLLTHAQRILEGDNPQDLKIMRESLSQELTKREQFVRIRRVK